MNMLAPCVTHMITYEMTSGHIIMNTHSKWCEVDKETVIAVQHKEVWSYFARQRMFFMDRQIKPKTLY